MIVLPSRGRPESLARFFRHSQPLEKGVVMLDQDDAYTYSALPLPEHWTIKVGPRVGYVANLNQALAAFPDEPWYAYGGDDVLCGPSGWDARLAYAAGREGIAYGDDGINGATTCCLPFIGGDLVRKVGWLGLPTLKHLYCDTVWHKIGQGLGVLTYRDDILTEHLHWSTGKQPYDRTAQERPMMGDKEAFESFMAHEFREVITRCKS